MNNPTIIHKTALAVIKDKKILLTREADQKEKFFMLGGRVEEGEAEANALHREVLEEIGCKIASGSLTFLQEFQALAHGMENTLVNIRLYAGTLVGEPVPSSEIEELRYFDSTIDKRHLTPISEDIFAWLKVNGHID